MAQGFSLSAGQGITAVQFAYIVCAGCIQFFLCSGLLTAGNCGFDSCDGRSQPFFKKKSMQSFSSDHLKKTAAGAGRKSLANGVERRLSAKTQVEKHLQLGRNGT